MSHPAEPRHTPEEHLVMAEDILDAASAGPPLNAAAEDRSAWAAQAQASALLAGGHVIIAAMLSGE